MVGFKPFEVERWMDKYESKASHDLAETCALSIPLKDLLKWSQEDGEPPLEESSVFTNKMGYGHITGSPKLKANIAACYDSASGITQDNVLITQGAIGANFLAILGLVQSGDHVVVVSPSYQQLQELPKSFGASVSLWSLQERHGWEHRVEDLKPLLRPNTRLVIVNNPNNPTGGIITTNTLQQIHAAVKEKAAPDAMILCDEVYSPMWHSLKDAHQGRPASLLEIGVDNVIVTGSMSKAFALAGLRVGWIVTPRKDLLARLLTIRDYNVISVSAVDDELAARALNPKAKQHLLERNIRLAQNNRAILHDWVRDTSKELGTRWSEPQAGNTALIYLGNGVDDAELCASLCEQKGVNIVPAGLCFGQAGWARVGYVGDTHQLKEGLAMLTDTLRSWRHKEEKA